MFTHRGLATQMTIRVSCNTVPEARVVAVTAPYVEALARAFDDV